MIMQSEVMAEFIQDINHIMSFWYIVPASNSQGEEAFLIIIRKCKKVVIITNGEMNLLNV